MFEHETVTTRIAPSPTGNLHIGTARAALFNYLFARNHGGRFIVRIEDTDRERSHKEYEDDILEGLAWLGLAHDALARQSQRLPLYSKLLETAIERGGAYLSREQSRQDPEREIEVVRLKNSGGTVSFTDLIRGEISFDTAELGDFVIARSIEEPLYHFAVVVDDAEMGISHVIRGEDHISNTPRQILIQEALGLARPQYAHIPLILASDRSKLSKRKGAVSLSEYRASGFLPEALVNYLALLGWNPGTPQELFTLQELIEAFSLEQVQKGGAVFNLEKLKWFNQEYLRRKSDEEQRAYLREALREHPALARVFEESASARADLLERVHTKQEIQECVKNGEYVFYVEAPTYAADLLLPKQLQDAHRVCEHLARVMEMLDTIDEAAFSKDAVRDVVWEYANEEGRGSVLWPMRVALSGRQRSPDPFTLSEALGKRETRARLARARSMLEDWQCEAT